MTQASPDATLASERALIDALAQILREEQRLLVAADTDALAGLTPQKAQRVQELAMLAAQRHRALGAAGFEAAEAGMAPWLAAHGSSQARADWEQLLGATREAKELNRVNGMLINKHMAHNQQLLAELRGAAQGADTAMYGPGGQAVGANTSRKFGAG
jgi:flagella synthesis protein FlgN